VTQGAADRVLQAGWFDLEAAARREAARLELAGDPDAAARRLIAAARRTAAQLRAETAIELLAAARGIDGAAEQLHDEALVAALRVRGAVRSGDDDDREERREGWQLLRLRAARRGDEELLACALLHLHADGLDEHGDALERACALSGGWAARARAWRARAAGDLHAAIDDDAAAVEHARANGDRLLEARSLEALAGSLGFLGRVEEAAGLLAHAATCYEQLGDAAGSISARATQAEVLALALRLDEALRVVDELERALPRAAGTYWACMVLAQRTRVELLAGDVTAAAGSARVLVAQLPRAEDLDASSRLSLLRAVEALLDAGDLPLLHATLERLDESRSEHAALEQELRVLHARALVAEDPSRLDEAARRIDVAALDDPFLRAEACAWLAWQSLLHDGAGAATRQRALVAALDGLDVHDQDALLRLLVRIPAALAAAGDGDDRPLRSIARTARTHGLGLWGARLDACAALVGANADAAVLAAARLESTGALGDADAFAAAVADRGTGGIHALRELLAHPALGGLAHRDAMRLVAAARGAGGGARPHRGASLLVVDGSVRVSDDDGLLLVATSGSLVHLDSCGEDDRVDVAGTVWSVDGDLARRLLGDEHGVTRRIVDRALDVAGRIEGLLDQLRANVASRRRDDGFVELDVQLVQQDVAQLASTSRKSATLALGQLRERGIASVRRGQVLVGWPDPA
jgi:hypothetical protein